MVLANKGPFPKIAVGCLLLRGCNGGASTVLKQISFGSEAPIREKVVGNPYRDAKFCGFLKFR